MKAARIQVDSQYNDELLMNVYTISEDFAGYSETYVHDPQCTGIPDFQGFVLPVINDVRKPPTVDWLHHGPTKLWVTRYEDSGSANDALVTLIEYAIDVMMCREIEKELHRRRRWRVQDVAWQAVAVTMIGGPSVAK